MSYITLKAHQTGSIKYANDKWLYKFRKPDDKCGCDSASQGQAGSLGYSNLLFVSLVSLSGLALALFSLMVELIWKRSKSNRLK